MVREFDYQPSDIPKNEDGKKIKVFITDAPGRVGVGVLQECLNHSDAEQILIINRKP
jgi:leucyl aminopeptidase